jgi:hypothetical protein
MKDDARMVEVRGNRAKTFLWSFSLEISLARAAHVVTKVMYE